MFYRWALLLDGAPAPQLLYTTDCTRLSPIDRELLDRYARYGANILCMERGLKKAGFHGREWGVVGDTLHDTTRYGEDPAIDPARRRSLGVVFRDWHPGPLLFQLTADALTYSYTDAMLLAIDAIAAEAEPLTRWAMKPAAASLPAPLVCDPKLCDVERGPSCLTYQRPTYGESAIRRIESGENAKLAEGGAAWIGDGWAAWAADPSFDMPDAERARPECAHLDSCAGLVAPVGRDAGWLRFELPPLEAGFLAVCCAEKHCGKRLLESGVEFQLDGIPVEGTPEVLWGGKCVRVRGMPSQSGMNEAAKVLGVRIPALQKPLPAISHVFGL